jgi:glycosyltransferase involved in cell wall biosynthesis
VGVQEVIADGRNGLLAARADPAALADALQRLLTQHEDAERMARAARADALRLYGMATMTARYEDLLLRGLEAPR